MAAIKSKLNEASFRAAETDKRLDHLAEQMARIYPHVLSVRDEVNANFAARAKGGAQGPKDMEHTEAILHFLKSPRDQRVRQTLADIDVRNASSGATDAAGGFLIPDLILGPLMKRASDANPFRALVRVAEVASRDINFPLSNANAATGWAGENATRTATTEPTLANAKPTFGILYSYVEASEELVMDSLFDIGSWFSMEVGDALAAAEATAIISGNGTDKPSGLLRVAPEAAADGSRTAGALRYLATGNASTYGSDLSSLLISLVYDLKAPYRSRGTWVMNSQVAGDIRKLKDGQARFLWTDGIAAGEASTLLGYPVAISEAMPGVAANSHPIMFGDFSRAYVLCENGGLRVTVDDNISKPGAVRWYLRRRLGGTVFDNNAVRAIKIAAS